MEVYLALNKEDIHKLIPFQIVAETMSSSKWNTGKRKRLMKEQFTESEIDATYRLHHQAREWHLYKGVPEEVKMKPQTMVLWKKLADFCYQL